MKKLLIAVLLFTVTLQLQAQTNFTALTLSPAYPKQHEKLTFTFNKSYSPLIKMPVVDIVVYQFMPGGVKATEPIIMKKGNLYSGTIMLDSTASCIAFRFTSGEEKDMNGGKGYIVPVYSNSNMPVKDYYAQASSIQNGYGEYLFGLATDADKGFQYLEDGIAQYPALKNDPGFLNVYLAAMSRAKRKEAPQLILTSLQDFEHKGNLDEKDYAMLIQWYNKDKRKEKADSLVTAMKIAFPNGDWAKNEAGVAFNQEKDPAKKLALYQAYISKYPVTDANKTLINNFKAQLAAAYAKAKDYSAYNEWNKDVDKAMVASSNNNYAWNMAEADDNIAEAKRMSYNATTYAKNELLKPTTKKPDVLTKSEWNEQRKSTYAMYGDTYAYILYKLGDYKEGYNYAKEAAVINKLKDAELNERYALLAEKTLPATESKKLIEGFVKEGVATASTKDALKRIYMKDQKSETAYAAYLAKLENTAAIKRRKDIEKTMISDPSPAFTLKDFDGNMVSLESLKGKVVVVDFWATWCGPCIASMPGMNRALTKYKDSANVKFVFVDTWETVDNKLTNAKDFMAKKKYPFYVLMDEDNKMVTDFKVSGIPTKFILDKNGRIRFKSVGFSGNADELVYEVSTMIEMAGM